MRHAHVIRFLFVVLPCVILISLFITKAKPEKEKTIRRTSPHVITLFMEPISEITPEEKNDLMEQIQNPLAMTKILFKEKFSNTSNQGVYITYAGYVATFDKNGQVEFPRKHQKDGVMYIITPKIEPIIFRGNTVEFFVRDEESPAAYYTVTRNFDEKNNLYYWETKKIETPKNKKIPASALVFFTKPEGLAIDEGITLAMKGPNLLLPPIRPTKKLNKNLDALEFLGINKFFAPVQFILQKENKATMRSILP